MKQSGEPSAIPCIKCKGSNPANCGRTFCPIVAKAEAMFKVNTGAGLTGLKEDFSTAAPAPFVGRFGYPHINVGILAPQVMKLGKFSDAAFYDAPKEWALQNLGVTDVVNLRSALINSRFKAEIKSPVMSSRTEKKFLEISQEVGMASKPVEIELKLSQKPVFRIDYNADTAPHGPRGTLKDAMITSNPKIDSRVDKVVSDSDLKATAGIVSLYDKGFDENFLSKMLSVGTLGMKKDRKLVPTRWSITATDDMLAKHLLDEIKGFSQSSQGHTAYFGGYLGNYYIVLMFPGPWSYELFEMYLPHANWNPTTEIQYSTDNEGYAGRKDYAANTQGGYYAARLGIVEKMHDNKQQASVLALRFITGEYAIPLGVWVVREATRKAMQARPIEFGSKELMMKYAEVLVKKKFGVEGGRIMERAMKESVMIRERRMQRRLDNYT